MLHLQIAIRENAKNENLTKSQLSLLPSLSADQAMTSRFVKA